MSLHLLISIERCILLQLLHFQLQERMPFPMELLMEFLLQQLQEFLQQMKGNMHSRLGMMLLNGMRLIMISVDSSLKILQLQILSLHSSMLSTHISSLVLVSSTLKSKLSRWVTGQLYAERFFLSGLKQQQTTHSNRKILKQLSLCA